MKTTKQIENARILIKKCQDYVVLAQAETKLKEQTNRDAVCERVDELTNEIQELAKNV